MIGAVVPMLAATAAAPLPDYPVGDVLAAFAVACAHAEDTEDNAAGALASGWERLPEYDDQPVSRLARAGERALKAADPEATPVRGGEYRKTVAGRTLYLAISGARASGATARGCRLYDFAAPRAPTPAELERWAGRAPEPALAHRGATKYAWSPGLKPAHADMQVIYVAPGSRPVPGFEIGGLAVIASALEF